MTKAERIRKLLDAGKTDAQIARAVGCGQPYVRSVRRRAINKAKFGACATPKEAMDARAYRIDVHNDVRRRRYADDPQYRERQKALKRESYHRTKPNTLTPAQGG